MIWVRRHLLRVGPVGGADPNPNHRVALDDGEGNNPRRARDLLLAWDLRANALRVEFEPVIRAADNLALTFTTLRQRHAAMDAAVL